MNIKKAQQIILKKLRGKDLLKTAEAFYKKQGKKINPLDTGVIGKFVEEYCFGKSHDNKQSRDLPCAELKTKTLKRGKNDWCFEGQAITKMTKSQIESSNYKDHPVFDKCSDIIIVFHYNNKLIRVGIIQPTIEDHKRASKDYEAIREKAKKSSSQEQFILSSYKGICEHGFFNVATKKFGSQKGRTFNLTSSYIKKCFQENAVCA